jgi:hypothetical protein
MKVSSQQMNKIVGAEVSSNNSVNIVINIEDINDNSPVFVPSKLNCNCYLKSKGLG